MCFSPLLDPCTLSPIFCLLWRVDWHWFCWMTEKGGKGLERETLESGCALGSSRFSLFCLLLLYPLEVSLTVCGRVLALVILVRVFLFWQAIPSSPAMFAVGLGYIPFCWIGYGVRAGCNSPTMWPSWFTMFFFLLFFFTPLGSHFYELLILVHLLGLIHFIHTSGLGVFDISQKKLWFVGEVATLEWTKGL